MSSRITPDESPPPIAALSAADWADMALTALDQTASGLLACAVRHEAWVSDPRPSEVPWHALIQLVSAEEVVEFGLLIDRCDCVRLGAAMLCQDPDELDDDDVFDAIREFVNVAGGLLEKAASELGVAAELGLPVVFEGRLAEPHVAETACIPVTLKMVGAQLTILVSRRDCGVAP